MASETSTSVSPRACRQTGPRPALSIRDLSFLLSLPRRIDSARWRARALVAVLGALQRHDLATERARADLRASLACAAGGCPARRRLAARVEAELETPPAGERGLALRDELFTTALRGLRGPAPHALRHEVRLLLALGRVEEARARAAAAPPSRGRHEAQQLVATGVWIEPAPRPHVPPRSMFVADVACIASFPPSLEGYRALLRAEGPSTAGRAFAPAEPRLRTAVRLAELGELYALGGLRAAEEALHALPARSAVAAGWLQVLRRALATGRRDDALRIHGAMRRRAPASGATQRATLALAADRLRRGELRAARLLLVDVDHPALDLEAALILAQLHLRASDLPRAAAAVRQALAAMDRPHADLSTEEELPRVEHRLALLCLGPADRGGGARLATREPIPRWCRTLVRDELAVRELPYADLDPDSLADAGVTLHDAARSEACREISRRVSFARWHAGLDPVREGMAGQPGGRGLETLTLARALYDEGLAHFAGVPRFAAVLASAARKVLVRARAGEQVSPRSIASRLRGLEELGAPATEQLCRALCAPPFPAQSELDLPIARTLGLAAPRRLVELLAGPRVDLLCSPSAAGLGRILEMKGELPSGFTASLLAALERLAGKLGQDALPAWITAVRSRLPAPPRALLELVVSLADAPDPESALDELERRTREARGDGITLSELGERFTPQLLSTIDAQGPVRHVRPWFQPQWSRALSVLRKLGVASPRLVTSHAQRFMPGPAGERLARRLLRGQLPVVDPVAPVDGEPDLRLRMLHKKRDLTTYLRFADIASCCYSSRGRTYFQHHALALWRDPLSFVYWIERRRPARADWVPVGFDFGMLTLAGELRAVTLNGAYPRRDPTLRVRATQAIERHLAAPLALRWIGTAGEPPPGYERFELPFMRLRAIESQGAAITRGYDDVAGTVNRTVARKLSWKRLR